MSNPTRQLHLNAFLLGVGHHLAAWRHPDARTSVTLDHYKDLARTAERGKFDALFFADYLGVAPAPARLLAQSALSLSSFFEPITLLSVLSTVTERLGLIGTVSTTYDSPFHLARRFASLDRLSGGRSGWNLVTSATDAEAKNFGLDGQIAHADRYARAREYVELVRELWDSWEDDAFIFDKEEARVFVPEKLHVPNHQGKYFSVAGPLNVERPVQGYPVLIQAGSSADGQELAAATAEIVFTAQPTLQEAQRFYRGLKALLPKFGRQPEDLLILPGVSPYIGRTEEEAREKFESLQALIPPEVGVGLLSAFFDVDFSKYPVDGPLPELPESEGHRSRQQLFIDMARRDNLSIRQLYQRVAGARGHWSLIGTPKTIADQFEEWFQNEAADGFNVLPPILPRDLNAFVDLVIPELQRRGLFRTEYTGRTLRENLGLRRPPNQYVARREQTAAA